MPFSEARAHLSGLVDRAGLLHDRILVTRGHPTSLVLVVSDDLDSLEESYDILRDGELMRWRRRSRLETAAGRRLRLPGHL